jgi:hypothetical protein
MIPECLVILVPGAGLEPARTLPVPRDFKSHSTLAQRHQTKSNPCLFRGLTAGVCSCLLWPFDGLGTATGTKLVHFWNIFFHQVVDPLGGLRHGIQCAIYLVHANLYAGARFEP